MKKLLYMLIILGAVSCNKDPDPQPGEEAKFQAPFGDGKVDVKLQKVLFNGLLEAEYGYEGDVLGQEKRYIASPDPLFSQTGVFKRNNGFPESFEVKLRRREAEIPAGDTLKPYYTTTYINPTSDSLRHTDHENFQTGVKSSRTFALDKNGFIVRQDMLNDKKEITATHFYQRNEQHNVSKTWTRQPGSSESSFIEYEYDNHPNPFFKLGMDAYGEISILSLSRNNPSKGTNFKDGKVISNTFYNYEYLPDGYPKKLTVRVESVNFPPYTYAMDFIY